MSFVSGLATAPGISSLLNAPRDTNTQLRASAGDPAATAVVRRQEAGSAARVMTLRAVERGEGPDRTRTGRQVVASHDSRYQQFMKALEVLRVNTGDEQAEESRRAELEEEAPQVFVLYDGRPMPVEPAGSVSEQPESAAFEETDKAA